MRTYHEHRVKWPFTGGDHAAAEGRCATLRRAVSSGRRRERLAIAASVVALIAAGYVGLGKPGWPAAASYAAVQPAK